MIDFCQFIEVSLTGSRSTTSQSSLPSSRANTVIVECLLPIWQRVITDRTVGSLTPFLVDKEIQACICCYWIKNHNFSVENNVWVFVEYPFRGVPFVVLVSSKTENFEDRGHGLYSLMLLFTTDILQGVYSEITLLAHYCAQSYSQFCPCANTCQQ